MEHPKKVVRCTLEELHFDGKRVALSWFDIQISNLKKLGLLYIEVNNIGILDLNEEVVKQFFN